MAKTYWENYIWSCYGDVADSGISFEKFSELIKDQADRHFERFGIKDPHQIQPSDESFDCCLCGRHFDGEYSHNANPVKDGRCCIECNAKKVMPVRWKL